eukprot:gene2900-1882_t
MIVFSWPCSLSFAVVGVQLYCLELEGRKLWNSLELAFVYKVVWFAYCDSLLVIGITQYLFCRELANFGGVWDRYICGSVKYFEVFARILICALVIIAEVVLNNYLRLSLGLITFVGSCWCICRNAVTFIGAGYFVLCCTRVMYMLVVLSISELALWVYVCYLNLRAAVLRICGFNVECLLIASSCYTIVYEALTYRKSVAGLLTIMSYGGHGNYDFKLWQSALAYGDLLMDGDCIAMLDFARMDMLVGICMLYLMCDGEL